MQAQKPFRRISPLSIGLISLLVGVIFVPTVMTMVATSGDYVANLIDALFWAETGAVTRPRPHFLYQLLVIAFHWIVPGGDFSLAAAALSIVSYVALGVMIYILVYPLFANFMGWRRTFAAFFAMLALMIVSPITVMTWYKHNLYLGYIAVHSYHNPTMIVHQPFALLLWLFAIKVFTGKTTSVRLILVCAGIAVGATLSKPNYALCLLPALSLLVVSAYVQKQAINFPLLSIGIAVPLGEVLAWQYFVYKTTGMGGFEFAPLKVMSYYAQGDLLPKFILSILFPLSVSMFYFNAARRDISLRVSWLAFLFACFYLYFLTETINWTDGNFAWGGEITLMLLFVTSTILFLRENMAAITQRKFSAKFCVCSSIWLLHVASGILFFLSSTSDQWRQWL
jgi:hypothetical protein